MAIEIARGDDDFTHPISPVCQELTVSTYIDAFNLPRRTNRPARSPIPLDAPMGLAQMLLYAGIVLTLLGVMMGFWMVLNDAKVQAERRGQDAAQRHEALTRCEWSASAHERDSCRADVSARLGASPALASMTSETNPPVNMAYR